MQDLISRKFLCKILIKNNKHLSGMKATDVSKSNRDFIAPKLAEVSQLAIKGRVFKQTMVRQDTKKILKAMTLSSNQSTNWVYSQINRRNQQISQVLEH